MDFIRNQIANFNRNDHDEDDNNNQDQTDRPTSDISPGQVEEAVHYMSQNGYIDISFLRFASSLSKYHKGVQIQDGVESFLDVAVFEVPEHCTSRNCDLSKYGVGSLTHFQGATYLSLCQAGRLMLDHNIFDGFHTQLMIPRESPMPNHITNGKFQVPKDRYYEVMLANCNQNGQHVHVSGQVVFEFQDGPVQLTNGSLALLISLAFTVFISLSILAVRINWGTRADFEYSRFASPPEQVVPTDNTDEDDQEEDDGEDDDDEHGETERVTIV